MKAKIILIAILLWPVSAFGQLNKIGLENYKVTSITVADNSYYEKFIVAGTENDGMYFHIVFVGLKGNILKSTDDGKTWVTCLSNIHDVVFTGILINPQKLEQIYAGVKYFNTDFIFFKSDDNGKSGCSRIFIPIIL